MTRGRRTRRMRLSVDPRTGAVKLSIPWRAALKPALEWAEGQRPWIESQLDKLPAAAPLAPGATIGVGGETLRIDWSAERPRRVQRAAGLLLAGGPIETLRPRLLRWLKAEALRVLTEESRAAAARAGVSVGRIGVGDPRSRWGSCAASGDIRYSWRLILAPDWVLRATVAHEVAHRVHMNHGPHFHALVAKLLGEDPAPARAWLRANGAALHWVGRES